MKFSIQLKMFFFILILTLIFLTALYFLRVSEENKISLMIKNQEQELESSLDKSIKFNGNSSKTFAYDYSFWDEIVTYVKNPTRQFEEINLDPAFTTFNMDFIWVYSKENKLIYSNNDVQLDEIKELPVEKDFFKTLTDNKIKNFFTKTSVGTIEIFGAPIQPSADLKRITPSQGYLFSGRLCGDKYLKEISTFLRGKVSLKLLRYKPPEKKVEQFSITAHIPIYGWNENYLGYFDAEKEYSGYKQISRLAKLQFYAIAIFSFFVLGCLSLFLFLIVNRPIKTIVKSFSTEDITLLEKLIKKRDEFGKLAKLIVQFFTQKENLGKEIAIREKTEQELIISKQKAEHSDKLKSEFLAQMSHEVRTPINAILSFSSLIKNELNGKVSDDLKMSFSVIDNAGKRIIRTIDLLLNVSEVQAGIYEPTFRSIHLIKDVLLTTYHEFRKSAVDKNLSFELVNNSSQEDFEIRADEYTIQQIFDNLVDNAIKYTQCGAIEIIIRATKKSVIVEIMDTGIGISEEYLPHIFNPFSQEEQGYTRRFEGNGLGLTLVKEYCTINNFQIRVTSKKNEGSSFILTIPL